MKKLILSVFFTSLAITIAFSQAGKLEIGMKAPEWKFPDAEKQEFTHGFVDWQSTPDQLCGS